MNSKRKKLSLSVFQNKNLESKIQGLLKQLSIAIVMDVAPGAGACTSSRKPASITACEVSGPKAPIFKFFCLKSGKFCFNDCTPPGEKNTIISYLRSSFSDNSTATVLKITASAFSYLFLRKYS